MTFKKPCSVLLAVLVFLAAPSSAVRRVIIHTNPSPANGSSKTSKTIYKNEDNDKESEVHVIKERMYPLDTSTYDGSGQANHPKVLYFKKGWNGYKYWMSFTPYPFCNAKLENPSVEVSNDGENWKYLSDSDKPAVKEPQDAARGGHNSDPHLVMCGREMELWYRYNPALKKSSSTDNGINKIYMIETANGVKWSKPRLILNDRYKYFSPAIIYENNTYKLWFSDEDGKLYFRQSADLKNWSAAAQVNLSLPGFCIWHQDVIKTGYGYQIVFSAYKKGEFSMNNQCLYYSESPDGMNFSAPVKILSPSKDTNYLDNKMIYRSSLVDVLGKFKLYYSAMSKNREWHIFSADFVPGKPKTAKS